MNLTQNQGAILAFVIIAALVLIAWEIVKKHRAQGSAPPAGAWKLPAASEAVAEVKTAAQRVELHLFHHAPASTTVATAPPAAQNGASAAPAVTPAPAAQPAAPVAPGPVSVKSPDGAIMTTTYTKNPFSNTPDWTRWSDTTPDGLPIFYQLGRDASGATVVVNPTDFQVWFDGEYMPPAEVPGHRAAIAARNAALAAQAGDVAYSGTINPATLNDVDFTFYAAHPAMWARAAQIFSGSLSGLNAALGNWYANGNKNADLRGYAGPLLPFAA